MVKTIDAHAGGEPARVIISVEGKKFRDALSVQGGGDLWNVPGDSMYEKREFFIDHLDWLRKLLLQEPRGYPCQNLDYIVAPSGKVGSCGEAVTMGDETER